MPNLAPTLDDIVLELRECRFDTPDGNFYNTGELRLSYLHHREHIAPGQVHTSFSVVIKRYDILRQFNVAGETRVMHYVSMGFLFKYYLMHFIIT